MNAMAGCETPPSYDVTMCTPLPDDSSSRSNLPNMTDADMLCQIDAGVQIYFITPEGYVSAPSYPSSLSIYLLSDGPDEAASASNCENPPAFLQVGNWIYPLLPGQSPVLQSNWGSYIFPDVSSSIPGICEQFSLLFSHFTKYLSFASDLVHSSVCSAVIEIVTFAYVLAYFVLVRGAYTDEQNKMFVDKFSQNYKSKLWIM